MCSSKWLLLLDLVVLILIGCTPDNNNNNVVGGHRLKPEYKLYEFSGKYPSGWIEEIILPNSTLCDNYGNIKISTNNALSAAGALNLSYQDSINYLWHAIKSSNRWEVKKHESYEESLKLNRCSIQIKPGSDSRFTRIAIMIIDNYPYYPDLPNQNNEVWTYYSIIVYLK